MLTSAMDLARSDQVGLGQHIDQPPCNGMHVLGPFSAFEQGNELPFGDMRRDRVVTLLIRAAQRSPQAAGQQAQKLIPAGCPKVSLTCAQRSHFM